MPAPFVPSETTEPPRHGYRGVPTPAPIRLRPHGLTIAISREAGSRGGTIAGAVGRLLGWQVYTHEMIDFLGRDEAARDEILSGVPVSARLWAEAEVAHFTRSRNLTPNSDAVALARFILALAARGDAIIVGRGAGFLLPATSTVHVRVIAPVEQRVAYLSQWLRLTEPEARAEVRSRDLRRATFLSSVTDRDPNDPTVYDMFLNSARLGLETAAELIAQVVRTKQIPKEQPPQGDQEWEGIS